MPVVSEEFAQYQNRQRGYGFTPFIFNRHLWFFVYDYPLFVVGSPCGSLLKWAPAENPTPPVIAPVFKLLKFVWEHLDFCTQTFVVLHQEGEVLHASAYRVTPRRALQRLIGNFKEEGGRVMRC